jgi:hypothetical protein
LRKNLVKKIEGLETNYALEELELYDNRIRTIENLAHLTNLVYLDLSFNRIRVIEGLDTLVNVKKLYLVSNRIKKVRFHSLSLIDRRPEQHGKPDDTGSGGQQDKEVGGTRQSHPAF